METILVRIAIVFSVIGLVSVFCWGNKKTFERIYFVCLVLSICCGVLAFLGPWSVTESVLHFEEEFEIGEHYGALTSDKVYLECCASMYAQIEPEHVDEYINMFGNADLSSDFFYSLAKSVSRQAIAETIASKDASYVRKNLRQVSEEVEKCFTQEMSKYHVKITWFYMYSANEERVIAE